MHKQSASARCAALFMLTALLAACSNATPTTSALPFGSSTAPQSIPAARGRLSYPQLLREQIAGKIHSPLARDVLKHQLREYWGHSRPRVKYHPHAAPGLWVSSPSYDFVFGQTVNGRRTVTAINTQANGCSQPYGIKVDHAQNLWVACYYINPTFGGGVQEYAPGTDTPSATYTDSSSCGSGCSFVANAEDVAFDATHVFAANPSSQKCVSSSCNSDESITWWSVGSPSSPNALYDPNLFYVDFIDTDGSGNLYVDGVGCIGTNCGGMLDKISNPTTSPSITTVVAPGTLQGPGGVYVSNGGTILNVVDQMTRNIYQYTLPATADETAFNVLGPTLKNLFGLGDPVAGGFNLGDTTLALGDSFGWVNTGTVATNKWQAPANYNFSFEGAWGAVYTPSDK
jgi:hypothetical protein